MEPLRRPLPARVSARDLGGRSGRLNRHRDGLVVGEHCQRKRLPGLLGADHGMVLGRTGWGAGSWTNITFRSGQTQFSALGQRGPHEALLYLAATGAVFPAGATNASLPLQQNQTVTLSGWPAGPYYAEWYDPETGTLAGNSQATAAGGNLTLPLPNYRLDLVGIVYPPPTLSNPAADAAGTFQFQLNSETGGRYSVLKSSNLVSWTTVLIVTNTTGTLLLSDSAPASTTGSFFRVRRAP